MPPDDSVITRRDCNSIYFFTTGGSYDSDSYFLIGFTDTNPCLYDYFVLCNCESFILLFIDIFIDDVCIEWGQRKLVVLVSASVWLRVHEQVTPHVHGHDDQLRPQQQVR